MRRKNRLVDRRSAGAELGGKTRDRALFGGVHGGRELETQRAVIFENAVARLRTNAMPTPDR